MAGFLNSNAGMAQKAYLSLDAGYAIPTSGYTGATTYTIYDDHTIERANHGGSNHGFNVGLHGGYMFHQNMGVDLGINFLPGQKTSPDEYIDKTSGNTSEITLEEKARSLRLSPALRFDVPLSRVSIFSRIGMGIYMFNKSYNSMESVYTSSSFTNREEMKSETKGTVSFGLTGAVGVSYKWKKIYLFAEAAYYQQTFVKKRTEVTFYTVNGEDRLEVLTVKQKITEYEKRIDDYNVSDSSTPKKELITSTPFSNLSLNVGIQLPF